ncbi:MAG: hypothetical protein R3Y65_00860 [Bacillota bacterium]
MKNQIKKLNSVFRFALGRSDDALTRAVTIMVVFCPCALALATPTAIMGAIGQATKNGKCRNRHGNNGQ